MSSDNGEKERLKVHPIRSGLIAIKGSCCLRQSVNTVLCITLAMVNCLGKNKNGTKFYDNFNVLLMTATFSSGKFPY